MKTCQKCGSKKPATEMYQEQSLVRKGPATWCKDCVKKWTEKHLGKATKTPLK